MTSHQRAVLQVGIMTAGWLIAWFQSIHIRHLRRIAHQNYADGHRRGMDEAGARIKALEAEAGRLVRDERAAKPLAPDPLARSLRAIDAGE
jgi:hypothetical protein